MRILHTFLYVLVVICLSGTYAYATVFTSVQTGNWTDPSTWDQPGIPTATDDVIIDGFDVTVEDADGSVTINSITLTNASNSGESKLIVDQSATLTITGNLIVTAENYAWDVRVVTYLSATLNVNGNAVFTKTADNTQTNRLQLYITNSSRVNILGNYTLNYGNGAADDSYEIYVTSNAILDIQGSTTINNTGSVGTASIYLAVNAQMLLNLSFNANLSGGDEIHVEVTGSSFFQVSGDVSLSNTGGSGMIWMNAGEFGNNGDILVRGDFNMTSGASGKGVELHGSGGSVLIDIDGDITMSAMAQDDVLIDLSASSTLELGGNISRPTNFGSITMDNTSTFDFNGTVSQNLPASILAGSGTDNFTFTNVTFNNTSSFLITLNGDMTVTKSLTLTKGIIETSNASLLIVADQATITGGSSTAYINGPMVKQGRSGGAPFVFPIGDASGYAPLEISKINSKSSEYEAQYFGDPPPFGAALAADVTDISSSEYWNLTKTAGSNDVDVTLYWTDADAEGIYNLDSLIVVGLSASNVWENYGNGGTTGGLGAGVSGSVSTTDGDPPPFGVVKFTFGNIEAMAPLPVELIDFRAYEDKQQNVVLSWETASELNNMHFVIERSADGKSFEPLETVNGSGTTTLGQFYSYVDTKPIPLAYYRLKQVDYDGSYVYLNVIYWEMNRTQKDRMAAFPTLAENEINLRFTTYSTKKSVLTIVNSFGKVMHSEEVYSTDLLEYRKLDLNNYVNGIYIIILSDDFNNVITRFVVSKTY